MEFYSRALSNFHYAIRDIALAAAKLERTGRRITHLNIGDPQAFGFRPPEFILEAVERALRDSFTGYAPSLGLVEARKAIADHAAFLGSPTSVDDVVVTAGSSEAADLILTALLNPGDEVLLPAPGYPLYPAIVAKLGATARYYRLHSEDMWQPDVERIASLTGPNVKAIVLINPSNPTGAITNDRTTTEILEIARAFNILVISDEVYRDLCFAENAPTPASNLAHYTTTALITLESLSKSHMVPGWRAGWMRMTNIDRSSPLVAGIVKLAGGRLCSPTPAQYAIRPALENGPDHLSGFLTAMRSRRTRVSSYLRSNQVLTCELPVAAFYMLFRFQTGTFRNDSKFVLRLLNETGILVVPGSGFGCDAREGYFRIVFLADEETLIGALETISNFAASAIANVTAAESLR